MNPKPDLSGVLWREMPVTVAAEEAREVEGIGVPWGELATLPGFTESMARGAVVDSDDVQLWWRHQEPIGRVVAQRDDEGGWWTRSIISKTPRGDEAYTLLRDGVVNKMSVGFNSIEHTIREEADGSYHVEHTKIKVREVSLVPLPAYQGADVLDVRSGEHNHEKREAPTMTPEEIAALVAKTLAGDPSLAETRSAFETLSRRFDGLNITATPEAEVDTRSAGSWLKAIAANDTDTIEAYNGLMTRAFEGGVLADQGGAAKPAWVGDLTRIIDEAAPLMQFFARGVLPDTGMSIEFAELAADDTKYEEQVNEGDDLVYGNVKIAVRTAPVKTFGGYSELSRQVIERSNVNILDRTLEAQAITAGKRMNRAVRAAYSAALIAQTAAGNTVQVPTAGVAGYSTWVDAIVDAAVKFEKLGIPMDGLLANTALFKLLGHIEAADGRPVLLVEPNASGGVNNVGTINPTALTAGLAGVTVRLDSGGEIGATPKGAFSSTRAIRSYVSPVVRLQDENIVNLTKQFSLYNYAAFANEVPAGIVPIEFKA